MNSHNRVDLLLRGTAAPAGVANAAGPPLPAIDKTFRPRIELSREQQDQLIRSRLGMAASLFTALRCKHAETAAHSIRVALYVSKWAAQRRIPAEDRLALEIASLLHDIGKIGLPDNILLKPGRLSPEERAVVDRHRLMGVEILSSSCASYKILEIVSNIPTWYDGSRMRLEAAGEELPLGSRMIAIADAYDSMVTPQVYRNALTHERALQELFTWGGAQFDPLLVESFSGLPALDCAELNQESANSWLADIDPVVVDSYWQLNRNFTRSEAFNPLTLFQQRLLDNMYDAVIFLDNNLQVMLWNRGTERMTGIPAVSMYQRLYSPQMLRLRDEQGSEIQPLDCPVAFALKSRVQSMRRMIIRGRGGKDISVNIHTIPVADHEGTLFGAAVLLHDASGEVSLEEQCQDWQVRATRDPLTKLANRAEFDGALNTLVKEHFGRGLPCSLIITDIDRFKAVNDCYGHQVGDQVLVRFAMLLKNFAEPGYLAARYGGEEFVILCANCNAAEATALAEKIRAGSSAIAHPGMNGNHITASFGVTELQPGDSPEILLRRADRGLYKAKEGGRNRVVQLGTGFARPKEERRTSGWWPWNWGVTKTELKRTMVTAVSLPMTIEKLCGFISDHNAVLISADDRNIQLEVTTTQAMLRRKTDRPETLVLAIRFTAQTATNGGDQSARGAVSTLIEAKANPKRERNRRRESIQESARHMLASLRAYLMANEVADIPTDDDAPSDSSSNPLPRSANA